jgi:hypothetical protein
VIYIYYKFCSVMPWRIDIIITIWVIEWVQWVHEVDAYMTVNPLNWPVNKPLQFCTESRSIEIELQDDCMAIQTGLKSHCAIPLRIMAPLNHRIFTRSIMHVTSKVAWKHYFFGYIFYLRIPVPKREWRNIIENGMGQEVDFNLWLIWIESLDRRVLFGKHWTGII